MPKTYSQLKTEVLTLTDSVGATDIEDLLEIVLPRAVGFLSDYVENRSLIKSKTYTWLSTDTAISITGGAGFNATDYEDVPWLLTVGDPAAGSPVPFAYYPYHDWIRLRGHALPQREGLDAAALDLRQNRAFTINFSNQIEIFPTPSNELVTFYYKVSPAAYADSGTPEIMPLYQDLIVDAGMLVVKFFNDNPGTVINIDKIFNDGLPVFIERVRKKSEARPKNNTLRVDSSYWDKGPRIR